MDYEYSDYYTTYNGPNLVSIMVNNIENKSLYNKIKDLYGIKNNWNGKLYKSKSIFDDSYLNKEITFNYENTKSGIPNWTKYIYCNGNDNLNSPLFTPISLT